MTPKPTIVVDAQTHRPVSSQDRSTDQTSESTSQTPSELPLLDLVARWMDSAFEIPGSKIRFGIDSILGLIPGFGDAATSLVSLFILHSASQQGVSRLTLSRMAFNVLIDFVVGSIPVVGDVFDVYWKANQKNVDLLRRHITANPDQKRRFERGDWWFLATLTVVLMLALLGSIIFAYVIGSWLWNLMSSTGRKL